MPRSNSYSEKAYIAIREKIASGELPAGSLASELSLAKALKMSRSPVREAIGQLIHEGLVEQVPRHGTIIRSPDRQDLAELYEVREALESYAVAEAARRIGSRDLARLRDLVQRMRAFAKDLLQSGAEELHGAAYRDFLATDLSFHETLIGVIRNRRIQQMANDMGVLVRIFGLHRQAHTLGVVRRATRFHGRILAAVRRGDAAAARLWMVRHLRASKRAALDALDRVHADAATERNESANGKPRGPHCVRKPGAS